MQLLSLFPILIILLGAFWASRLRAPGAALTSTGRRALAGTMTLIVAFALQAVAADLFEPELKVTKFDWSLMDSMRLTAHEAQFITRLVWRSIGAGMSVLICVFVPWLVANNTRASAITTLGKTAIDAARQNGHSAIVQMLGPVQTTPSKTASPRPKGKRGLHDLDRAARECASLLNAANLWGERRQFDARWMEESPQYREICGIGRAVHQACGIDGMELVIKKVRQQSRVGYLLSHFWEGTGVWIP